MGLTPNNFIPLSTFNCRHTSGGRHDCVPTRKNTTYEEEPASEFQTGKPFQFNRHRKNAFPIQKGPRYWRDIRHVWIFILVCTPCNADSDDPAGIGKALAEKFIENGSYVIASGRRKENLEQLVHKHGHDKVSAVPFDITNLDGIPDFANKYITHPRSRQSQYSNLRTVSRARIKISTASFSTPESSEDLTLASPNQLT